MLADLHLLAQVIIQACALVLLLYGAIFSIRIMQKWRPGDPGELQLLLERRSYLISKIVQIVLIIQIANLLIQMYTLNIYLPGVIRGAMCATGVLGLYPIGYSWLYVRLLSVVLSTVYLFMNRFDNSEPEFPLTPLKHKILPPLALLWVADFVLMILFFMEIKPDVVATCCSLSLSITPTVGEISPGSDKMISASLFLFYGGAALLFFLLKQFSRFRMPVNILAFIFLAGALYSLKYHFVKYIYALPSHSCLFDLFLPDYHSIGYLIFILLLVILICILFLNMWPIIEKRLRHGKRIPDKRIIAMGRWSILLYTLLISHYWLFWVLFR